MSTNRDDDLPGDDSAQTGAEGVKSNRASQLFGHKGGASPWENPVSPPPPAPIPATASAPYPRDAQYTPRPAPEETAPELTVETPSSSILPDNADEDGELTRLHPNYKLMMRIGAIIAALTLIGVASLIELVLRTAVALPMGVIMVPAAVLALFIALRIPAARYSARGYQISRDRLRVVRGIMWHSDTVVPFGRVQHIDVDQGPIERALGIATMTLHTAGSHNASVSLPGLGHELAIEMREEIRAHIKRESM
ncbi:PH domain-containing protein [Qipengyuania sp. ASV99]|uniref:PH domain-containing protein n=1 Tax=Qipengyuania sp. ASV99 TaxID=3399681 RepID=UPI003A4C51A5